MPNQRVIDRLSTAAAALDDIDTSEIPADVESEFADVRDSLQAATIDAHTQTIQHLLEDHPSTSDVTITGTNGRTVMLEIEIATTAITPATDTPTPSPAEPPAPTEADTSPETDPADAETEDALDDSSADAASPEASVVDVLEEHGELTGPEIREESGLVDGTFYGIVSSLKNAGRIETRKDPRDGRRTLYRLAGTTPNTDLSESTGDEADDEDGDPDSADQEPAPGGHRSPTERDESGASEATATDGGATTQDAEGFAVGEQLSNADLDDATAATTTASTHDPESFDSPDEVTEDELVNAAKRGDVRSLRDLCRALGLEVDERDTLRPLALHAGVYDTETGLSRPEGSLSGAWE